MLRLLAILLLFNATAHAGHRVALLIGGGGNLKNALVSHGFIVTVVDDSDRDEIKSATHLFIQGIPTKGLALVYTNQREPEKLVNRLQRDSGATTTIVLSGENNKNKISRKNGHLFAHVDPDFPDRLTLHPGQTKHSFLDSLKDAIRASEDQLISGEIVLEPDARKSVFPPDKVQPGKTAGSEWVNGYGMVFCWCPEKSGGFWMSKYEVTLREFNALTRKNPPSALATHNNHPRDGIHYDDIQQFVQQLNQRERFFQRIPKDWKYALPTIDQWTLAANAGAPSEELAEYANFADASLFKTGDDFYHYAVRDQNDQQPSLAIVGSYPPNSWGIHDLLGNLWEWTDSVGNKQKPGHPVACGGSWVSLPSDCTPQARRKFPKRTEKNFIGFRVVLRPSP